MAFVICFFVMPEMVGLAEDALLTARLASEFVWATYESSDALKGASLLVATGAGLITIADRATRR